MTDRIITEKRDGVGWLTFNNPARHNALSFDMWSAMPDAFADFDRDDDVRLIILTGAGGKAFVSGADISEFEDKRAAAEAIEHYDAAADRAFAALHGARKPTIAMIRGYCIGGGLAVALGCDLRFASAESRFGIPAARLGLGYQYPGLRKLVATVGHAFAREILFTARQFDAAEAAAIGLVNRVVMGDELEAFVAKTAASIAQNAPLTIRAAKLAIDAAIRDESERDLAAVEQAVNACFTSQDYAEGRRAFVEKRRPAFRGR